MDLAQLKQNRNALFWSLHVLGWSAYGVSQYVGALLYGKPVAYVQYIAVAAASGCILTMPLRYICRWLWRQPPPTMIAGALAAAWVTAGLLRVIMNWFYHAYVDLAWPLKHWTEFFGGTLSSMYLITCWIGLYFGVRYYESLQSQRIATLQAASLAQEAQLKMLRYQLNPHFLFNTLNAISTLILDNRNSTANNAVTGLSEFLRYTLDQDPMKKVTVAQEMDALNLYLNIETMRFGSRLKLNYAIEEAASCMLVPSLLLQPLIENAIKYAVSPREQGGQIRIGAHITGGMLQLEVADDGPGMIDATRLANGRGVGIRNTRERLQVLYGDRGIVAVTNTDPGLRVSLTFPAERATAPSGAGRHE
ncbi:sensor histidine kinase [Steroidobacter cummioxidans]|uniref:sensor histidine kinase n=1 Tax=Steroidobacter cummioxidans TaxID=1803913 RepID=UPI00137A289C|nr:histidine kinase [Steroidobacter cummioxidans]